MCIRDRYRPGVKLRTENSVLNEIQHWVNSTIVRIIFEKDSAKKDIAHLQGFCLDTGGGHGCQNHTVPEHCSRMELPSLTKIPVRVNKIDKLQDFCNVYVAPVNQIINSVSYLFTN